MQWPRRGILIRLAIYVPLISILAWRAQGGCGEEPAMQPDNELEQQLAPHRKVITLPDGTQQSIVEMTPEQAEAILGHPIPELDGGSPSKAAKEGAAGGAKAGDSPAPGAGDGDGAAPGGGAVSPD